jgi:hypothetical protein
MISEQASTLVREEIELARTEMEIKAKRLARGAAVGAAAGFFGLFALIYAFQALAWGLNDLFESLWLGFVIVMVLFIVLGALAGLIAKRSFEAGTPPVPQQAIEQAKLTREALEHPELVPAGAPEAAGRTSVASGQLPGTEAAPSDRDAKES